MSHREDTFPERYYRTMVAVVLALSFFNLFAFLGSPPVADWDEARHGVTACEMTKSGNYIMTTYLDNPDYWNLKPPLGFWLIAVAYKLFGYSIFSLRFFSAFFAFMTVLLTILLARRHYGKAASVIAGIALSTTYGFISYHSGRSGDFDSAMTFFTVLFVFFLDRTGEDRVYFYLAGLTASCAFLLKSFASVPLFFIAVIYLLVKRRYKILSLTDYLLFLAAWFAPLAAWALARYAEDGRTFFDSMITYDLLKRSAAAIEGHSGGPAYYFFTLASDFSPWSILGGLGVLALSFSAVFSRYGRRETQEQTHQPLPAGLTHLFRPDVFWIWLIVPLVLFSLAKTKLPWYITPVYPVLSIFLGHLMASIPGSSGGDKGENRHLAAQISVAILVVCACAVAETKIYGRMVGGARSIDDAQALLYRIPKQPGTHSQALFLTGEASQARVFIAKVLKNLRINPLGATEFRQLAESFHSDLISVELRTREHISSSRERILRDAGQNDLVLMENTADNQNFLLANGFIPADKNAGWILARKSQREKEEAGSNGLPACELAEGAPGNSMKNINVNYAGKIKLLGISDKAVANDRIMLSYYWQLIGEPGFYNHVFVHFTNDHKTILFQDDHIFCLGRPAMELKGAVIKETRIIPVPPVAAGKKVHVRAGIFDPSIRNNDRLKIEPAAGLKTDDEGTRAEIKTIHLK